MSFFEFPNTRTYDSDLGWLIKEMKAVMDTVAAQNDKIAAVELLAQELKNFVNNYFDNLDVQNEINNKIDAMVADGTLLNLLESPISEYIADWLANNITPTTPAVDASLSVEGAAADAKATGAAILPNYDMNTLIYNAEGKYINRNGGETANPDWGIAGYIPVYGGSLYLKGAFSNLGNLGYNLALYSGTTPQTFIRGITLGNEMESGRAIDVSDANYIRICNPMTTAIEYGFLDADKAAFMFEESADIITPEFTEIGFLNTSGDLTYNAGGWKTTPFIPVCYNDLYVTGDWWNLSGVGYNIALYDESYHFLRGYTAPDHTEYFHADAHDASFVRLCSNFLFNQVITCAFKKNPTFVVVDKAGSGQYTSLLRALKETDPTVKIILKSGVYDLITEYTEYYGASYWDNYAGYINSSDPFDRGLWMAQGREIVGEAGAAIVCQYTGSNQNVKDWFSVISNAGNVRLENVRLQFRNVRYAIHDDYDPVNSTIIFKNIHFIGEPYNVSVIGAGFGKNSTYYIEGCVFGSSTATWDINYHGSNNPSTTNKCKLYVKDCVGLNGCGVWSNGPSTYISDVFVSNSKFSQITKYTREGYTTNNNVALTQWCNEIG